MTYHHFLFIIALVFISGVASDISVVPIAEAKNACIFLKFFVSTENIALGPHLHGKEYMFQRTN